MGLQLFTHAEQVAAHLRSEILRGRWSGELPGVNKLEVELDVNHTTIGIALKLLEKEGLLVFQGLGRRRQIVLPRNQQPPSIRIAFLDFDPFSRHEAETIALVDRLSSKGLIVSFTEKTLVELDMNLRRISNLVKKTDADAWIVASAPYEVLQWFLKREIKTFALFGGFEGLPVACVAPDYLPAILKATRCLLGLGHRRIVFLANRGRKQEPLGSLWRAVYDELEHHGVPTGPYNLPEWEDSAEGFHEVLESLFLQTPPTAILIEEIPHFVAALNFCTARGLRVPADISLVILDHHTYLDYCVPSVTCIRWNHEHLTQPISRWARNVARQKDDRRQKIINAEFVEGGTIGPCK